MQGKMIYNARRIVIKIGSSLLMGDDNYIRKEWLASLAEDIAVISRTGKQIIVVSSGAVALGRYPLKLGLRLLSLEEKQAAAACGQIELLAAWRVALGAHGFQVAQLLLTADDIQTPIRYSNARNTLNTLMEHGVIPIINENDTVATEELRFGDNDRLAARVAQMAGADVLVLFSDVNGLYNKDPHANPDAIFQTEITDITPDIVAMAAGTGSNIGTGGMVTKIASAKIATKTGCHMIISQGKMNNPLQKLWNGEKHTLFISLASPLKKDYN